MYTYYVLYCYHYYYYYYHYYPGAREAIGAVRVLMYGVECIPIIRIVYRVLMYNIYYVYIIVVQYLCWEEHGEQQEMTTDKQSL